MMLTRNSRGGGESVAMHICQPQIRRVLLWTRIRACAVRGRRQSV